MGKKNKHKKIRSVELSKIIHLLGKILGLVKTSNYHSDWIIQLNDGGIIQTLNYSSTLNDKRIKYTYFVDNYESIKTEVVGKTIWLNYVDKGNPMDNFYSVFVLSDLTKIIETKRPNFKRFEKVEIIDLIPFTIYSHYGFPFYLKIKSDDGRIGFIQYTDNINKYPSFKIQCPRV